ncbi:MAG: acyl-coenzyme A thioesterase PaaI-like protein, partial [Bacteriovoracaceae bacterium]
MSPSELIELYKKINQFDKHLDFDLKMKDGVVTYEVIIEDKHLSSPGTCHGGVLAGLMDNVLGVTALAYAVTEDKLCS